MFFDLGGGRGAQCRRPLDSSDRAGSDRRRPRRPSADYWACARLSALRADLPKYGRQEVAAPQRLDRVEQQAVDQPSAAAGAPAC